LKDEAQAALFKDPVRTAQQTLFISAIKTSQLCCMGQKSRSRYLFWDKYKTHKCSEGRK